MVHQMAETAVKRTWLDASYDAYGFYSESVPNFMWVDEDDTSDLESETSDISADAEVDAEAAVVDDVWGEGVGEEWLD